MPAASCGSFELDQLIGKTDFDLFPADVARSFQSYDKAMLEAGKGRRNEEWLTYPVVVGPHATAAATE
jgi:hypothetical protein